MQQFPIVCALVKKGEHYLFLRQIEGGAYPETLHIPGGSFKPGMDLEEAVRQEIEEETNVKVKNVVPFDFSMDITDFRGGQNQLIFLRFTADYESGEAKAGSDAKDVMWIHKDDLGDFPHNAPSLDFFSKLDLI